MRYRLAAALLATVGLLVLVSSPASARAHVVIHSENSASQSSGPFTLYKLGSNRSARSMTEGPDGAVWFTMNGHDRAFIGRVTTSGRLNVYHSTSPFFGPTSITTGSDGAMWFTTSQAVQIGSNICSGRFAIGRITTQGRMTFYTDPRVRFPGDIFAGPDGALWFLNGCSGVPLSLERMTTSGVVTNSFSLAGVPGFISGITAGPDGAMWFSDMGYWQGSGPSSILVGQAIGRITTSGSITMYPETTGLVVPNEGPFAITAGPDGALWFANQGGACQPAGQGEYCLSATSIGRITTSGVFTTPYYPANGYNFGKATGPEAMTAGPDNSVWFANFGLNPSIGQITTSGTITVYSMTGVSGGPESITTGSDGALWFIDSSVPENSLGIPIKGKRATNSIGRLAPP